MQEATDRAAALDKREAELDEREAALAESEAEAAAGTFPGDGTFVVGEDIEAGECKTGPAAGGAGVCYHASMSDTSADVEIIDNGLTEGQDRVTLDDGDVFESQGCSEWTLLP